MSTKKIIVAVIIILVAIGGFVAGLMLLRQRQDLREEASVPGGQATVSINPASGSYKVGDTINFSVLFNTANIPVSGIEVRLTYVFSGQSPEVSVSSIDISSALLSSGDWTCPTKDASQSSGNIIIDIGCSNISASGYSTGNDTLLASISLKINRAPSVSPLHVGFDNAKSVITQKSTGEDILLVPTSSGSYEIQGAGGAVPTATTAPANPTPTRANTPASTSTPSPTKKPTSTPVATTSAQPTTTTKGGEELPVAGVSYPTIVGVGIGIMVIVGSLLLAL